MDLSQVSVIGDLVLASLPQVPLATMRKPLAGVRSAREGLGLDNLERHVGRVVARGRVVSERVSVTNASIFGRILGPRPSKRAGDPYAPVIFAQPVTVQGSTIYGDTDLPHARFLMPLRAERAVFRGKADFEGVTFEAPASFTSTVFLEPASFDRSDFKDVATFDGVAACSGARFLKTKFANGVWFHATDDRPSILVNANFHEAVIRGRDAVFDDMRARGRFLFHQGDIHADARFSRATFEGPVQFNNTKFAGAAMFNRARFFGQASFDTVSFGSRRATSFDDTYFWSASFDSAQFTGNADFVQTLMVTASFRDVEYAASADYRRAIFGTAEFGGLGKRTIFRGPASFDEVTIRAATFQNALFENRASFTGASFGESSVALALDLGGVLFRDAVVFDQATFHGLVNLSNSRFDAGRLSARWRQFDGRIASGTYTLDGERDEHVSFAIDKASVGASPRHEVLRSLEQAFASQNRLEDANAVYQVKQNEELEALINDATLPFLSRAAAQLQRLIVGAIAGYGVSPWRIVFELLAIWFACGVAYATSVLPLSMRGTDPLIRWSATEIPVSSPSALRALPVGRRMVAAFLLSLAGLTGVVVRGIHAKVPLRHWIRKVLIAERVVGAILLALFWLALTNTVPVLAKLVGWLLPS